MRRECPTGSVLKGQAESPDAQAFHPLSTQHAIPVYAMSIALPATLWNFGTRGVQELNQIQDGH